MTKSEILAFFFLTVASLVSRVTPATQEVTGHTGCWVAEV